MCSELIFPFEFPNEKGNYKLIWQFSFHIDRFRELVGTSSLLGDKSLAGGWPAIKKSHRASMTSSTVTMSRTLLGFPGTGQPT